MAVQAHFYSENTGLPVYLQDWSGSQVFGIDNGLLFSSLPYPPQPQPQQHQSLGFECNQMASPSPSFSRNTFPSIPFSQALNDQLEIQRHEIDRMLLSQNEKLRHALQLQRKQQVAMLVNGLESKSMSLIRQKEDDLAEAKKKSIELEDWLRKAEIESEAWQRIAREKEAMVMSLTSKLEEVKERRVWDRQRAEDTESCSGPHLCSCYFCEALLEFCPVCKSAKEGCLEVLLA
ncbi:putative BOI-related E3 ubiquitin-protein ligase 2 [Senna tora]|uniref:Putative BOI-related E3 ubiquitin-protein ligase 2 n=1 Tax=Senna tora TaxID=362788 RepID=A0A834U0R8_9FABA|nr:putative BOI-related E3 ubiquitin-protein ligase 2 [Senna tora]